MKNIGIAAALLSAILFGASTPLAKLLLEKIPPTLLAGILYLGSGIGLLSWLFLRRIFSSHRLTLPSRSDWPWLSGAILSGGIAAPLLLMLGLTVTPASSASLLLNLEGVFTALLAWFVFRENFDRRIFIGMVLIVIASLLLSWQQTPESGLSLGAIAIVGACLCWAIDNNLTRKISNNDPVLIAGIKGLMAGLINLSIAYPTLSTLPSAMNLTMAALIGLFGYGISLVMFVLALRHLGTARTAAYFSAAPFIGTTLSLILLNETPGLLFWGAALLMSFGILLHLAEHHEHQHQHEELSHTHEHTHDEHHQHVHKFSWNGEEPHTHYHVHQPLLHKHPHFPDIHHQHTH